MRGGEIHLAMFPFGGTIGAKLRPVLLLTGPLGSVPEFLTAYMTSVVPPSLLTTDILIDPSQPQHSGTGLKQMTLLRLHKLATIHDGDILRHLGQVSTTTWSDVETKLRLLLNLP
ncbi:MAG: type II toxin-antitoxin system PemK/MazF family toxin [Gemmataceae bacterium]